MTPPVRFKLVAMGDLTVQTSGRYLIKGLLPAQGLVVVWGPPKSGKSFWTTDAALHVAAGLTYCGRRTRQGVVVYVCAEGTSGIGARVEAWRRQYLAEDAGNAAFFVLPERLDLIAFRGTLIADIQAQLGDRSPALIVIDTLNRTFSGSESSDESMTAYVQAADALTAAFGCCVAIVHHCGIDGTRPRGHTSLTGAADAQIAIKRDADRGIVGARVEWMKDGPEDFDENSRLEVVEVGTDEDGEPVTSCVVVASDEAPAPTARKTRLSPSNTLALEALRQAVDENGHSAPASNHIPQTARVVPLELWRKYLYARLSDKEPGTRQKAFTRAAEQLQTRKLIQIWDDLVWICAN